MSFFTNGFFGRSRKRAAANASLDKENSYPKAAKVESKAKKELPQESPFAGAVPAPTGSWIVYHDADGNPYWWNDVTGQWTYQLFSTSGYMPPMMQGPAAYMYPQQQYDPFMMGQYHPLQHQSHQQQQQPWLISPAGGQSYQQTPWGPLLIPGLDYDVPNNVQVDGEEEEEEDEAVPAKGTWDKFFDGIGRAVWINSISGERTSVKPLAA